MAVNLFPVEDYEYELHEALLVADGLIRESLGKDSSIKLKSCILKLEELVSELKEDGLYTAFWRKHLAQRWQQYSDIIKPSSKAEVKDAQLRKILAENEDFHPDHNYILRKPPARKSPIIERVEKVYSLMNNIKDLDDFENMRIWLSDTAHKVFPLVPPQLKNPFLQRDAYMLAVAKFPPGVCHMFNALYDVHSLYTLFDFIRTEVEFYTENNRHLSPNRGISLQEINRKEKKSRDDYGNQISPCSNCNQPDHTIKYCTTLDLSFCLTCYR